MKGIKVTVNGQEIPYQDFTIRESYNQVCTEVEVILFGDVKDNSVTIDGSPFYQVKSEPLSNGTYKATFWPDNYIKLMDKMFEPINKKLTFEDLCAQCGVQLLTDFKTSTVYWCMPQLKWTSWLKEVEKRIVVTGGGGVVSTVVFNGKLQIADMKKTIENGPTVQMVGKVEKLVTDLSYRSRIPSYYKVHKNSIEKDEKDYEIIFQDNWGKGILTPVVFIEDSYDNIDQMITNTFYKALYTSKFVQYKDVTVSSDIATGMCIKDVTENKEYFIWEYVARGTQDHVSLDILCVNKA